MFEIKKRLNFKNIFVAILVSFISVNIYWLLTITYTLPVKKVGESSVLTGIEAANHLVEEKGFSIYLNGMLGYYLISILVCIICYLLYQKQKSIIIFFLQYTILALLGSIVYYIFSVKIFIRNNVEGISYVLSGIDALANVPLMQSVFSIIGIWLILFFTIIVSVGLSQYLKYFCSE